MDYFILFASHTTQFQYYYSRVCYYFEVLMQATRSQKQQHLQLFNKLETCEDQLAQLLDLIYKFPQQQRQRFYDRIQLLRQNLTQLKICVKDNQHSLSIPITSLDKRYQQIFIKINDLKAQINSTQLFLPSKKNKKAPIECQSAPLFSESVSLHQTGGFKLSKAGKSEYDAIMQTIVQKDEQSKHYKAQLQKYKQRMSEYQKTQHQQLKLAQQLQHQLKQIQQINIKTQQNCRLLQHHVQQLNIRNQTLELLSNQYKIKAEENKKQIQRIQLLLSQFKYKFQCKKVQADNAVLQFTTLEEKYKYDVKMYMDMESKFKNRERCFQGRVEELERELEERVDCREKNKQLLMENIRLKEDIKVLEAQLIVKQQQLFQKSKKIQSAKNQANDLESNLQQLKLSLQKKQLKIQELLSIQTENQNIILLLERRSKDLQISIAQLEEQKMGVDKKCRLVEEELKRSSKKCEQLKQKICLMEVDLRSKQQNFQRATSQRQRLQKQIDRATLQVSKTSKKCEQQSRIMKKIQEQSNQLKKTLEQKQKSMKIKQQACKEHQKQNEVLKKRLLRAKIESIHNLRQILS